MVTRLAGLLPPRTESIVIGRPADVRQRHLNLVLVRRPRKAHDQQATCNTVAQLPSFRIDEVLDTLDPHGGSSQLVAPLPRGDVRDTVQRDVVNLARVFLEDFGYKKVHARLEVVHGMLCSKWHADTVGIRCLVTYSGPGTLFIDNRHVRRKWDLLRRHSEVAAAEEQHAQQASPGDWLFLKGHLWEGNAGLGAVHRSPEGAEEEPRLLLTLDDVLPEACGCGHAHCGA